MNRPKVSRLPWALCLKRLRGSATLGFDKDRYAHGLHDHPWSFTPLRPERVVEVRYERMQGIRFRHTARFDRWRPDRDPPSCTYEQLEEPVKYDLADILAIKQH
jgi:ATP-dependent DNA ligase